MVSENRIRMWVSIATLVTTLLIYFFTYSYIAIGSLDPMLFFTFLSRNTLAHLAPFLVVGVFIWCLFLARPIWCWIWDSMLKSVNQYMYPLLPPAIPTPTPQRAQSLNASVSPHPHFLFHALYRNQSILHAFYRGYPYLPDQYKQNGETEEIRKQRTLLHLLMSSTDAQHPTLFIAAAKKSPLSLYTLMLEITPLLDVNGLKHIKQMQNILYEPNKYLLFTLFDTATPQHIDKWQASVSWPLLFSEIATIFGARLFLETQGNRCIETVIRHQLRHAPDFMQICLDAIKQHSNTNQQVNPRQYHVPPTSPAV